MTEALIGLGGVIVGIILTEAFTWWRTTRVEQRQKESLRNSLFVEMSINAQQLQHYLDNRVEKLHAFDVVWRNNTAEIISLLTPEEVVMINFFYYFLDLANHGIEHNKSSIKKAIDLGDKATKIIEQNQTGQGLERMADTLDTTILASKREQQASNSTE